VANDETVVDGPREWLAGAAAGDRSAWDSLVDRYNGLLWSIARSYRLGDHDAGDVVQTTWLRLLDNLDRIDDPERVAGWLATTARRECLHVLRRTKREPVLDVIELLTPAASDTAVDAGVLRAERDSLLWQVFDSLSDACRRLLRVLIADPAPSYADVAAALDMPVGSIGPTRQRCLAALRTQAVAAGLSLDVG
jgi:RNA polymerase sigma factor (sigma-70 family)